MSPLEFLGRGGTEIGENRIEPEKAESGGSDGAGRRKQTITLIIGQRPFAYPRLQGLI